MKTSDIASFVTRYLEATNCKIIEKAPGNITVKLSPEADKALTGRSYYWDFVERTGAPAETMSFTFVFDEQPEKQTLPKTSGDASSGRQPQGSANSILGSYLGVISTYSPPGSGPRKELLTYGCRRLEQVFSIVREQGKYVMLYEDRPQSADHGSYHTEAYTSWLGVNYIVEFACDMKRDELHSLGMNLSTGEIVTQFHDELLKKRLTPKLPPGAFIRRTISLERAVRDLEQYLEKLIRTYDAQWAREAHERLSDELARIDDFYGDAIREAADEQTKLEITEQYKNRKNEIEWQYAPRIIVNIINCGIFHLFDEPFARSDASR